MAKRSYSLGGIAFLVGVLISVISAFISLPAIALFIAALMGFIVAFSNITMKESQKALLWAIGMAVAGAGAITGYFTISGITFISQILANLGTFFLIIAFIFLIKVGWKLSAKK